MSPHQSRLVWVCALLPVLIVVVADILVDQGVRVPRLPDTVGTGWNLYGVPESVGSPSHVSSLVTLSVCALPLAVGLSLAGFQRCGGLQYIANTVLLAWGKGQRMTLGTTGVPVDLSGPDARVLGAGITRHVGATH